jgi:hypothetical protein
MDRFSFVMVLLSIIVGLGVTELLTNIARQIQSFGRTKFSWLHSLLVALVFVSLLQQWWESWDQRLVEDWSFLTLLMMLGGPVGLYLISHLLYPATPEDTDFEAYYFQRSKTVYLIAAGTVVLATLYRPLSFGHALIDPDNAPSLFVLAIFLGLAFTDNKWAHRILVPLILASAVFDILYFHMSI